jgi:hypothetical protein
LSSINNFLLRFCKFLLSMFLKLILLNQKFKKYRFLLYMHLFYYFKLKKVETELFLKGIVSGDFEVCFWYLWIDQTLLPLTKQICFVEKKTILCRIFFITWVLGSLPKEQNLARGVSVALFVAPDWERPRKMVQMCLKHNKKCSFDREHPRLFF